MWVPVAVWQLCELLYTCYLLTYLLDYCCDRAMTKGMLPFCVPCLPNILTLYSLTQRWFICNQCVQNIQNAIHCSSMNIVLWLFIVVHHKVEYNNTTTAILQPWFRSICVSWNPQLRTGGFCLVQSFTACMPFLSATSTFRLGRRRWSSHQLAALPPYLLHSWIVLEKAVVETVA